MATSSSATSKPASAPRNAIGARLRVLLEDLGFLDEDLVLDLEYCARVITRRSGRAFEASRLKTLLFKSGIMTAEEVAIIADGLCVDARELLYDEGEVPLVRERGGNPLDNLATAL